MQDDASPVHLDAYDVADLLYCEVKLQLVLGNVVAEGVCDAIDGRRALVDFPA